MNLHHELNQSISLFGLTFHQVEVGSCSGGEDDWVERCMFRWGSVYVCVYALMCA